MNRSDFQKLSRVRLREAQALLQTRNYSGAYYLLGYVVECALKACICSRTRRGDFPPSRKALDNIYTHDLEKLVKGAELDPALNAKVRADPSFAVNWALVKDWSEESRYEIHGRRESQDFLQAIVDPSNGIMEWLQLYW